MSTKNELHPFPASRAEFALHPAAEYAGWRDTEDGLSKVELWNGKTAWFVTRPEHLQSLLTDKRVSADRSNPNYPLEVPVNAASPSVQSFRSMDGDVHALHRRYLAREFSAPRIEALRPSIRATIDELIDEMKAKGSPADLVADFALPLPMRITCELIGVPWEDRDKFDVWVNALLGREGDASDAAQAGKQLAGYVLGLIEQRTAEPKDDLISRVVGGPLARGEITSMDAMATVLVLLLGGYESTAFTIGSGILALLKNPEQLALVQAGLDKDGIARMVEELLRYTSVTEAGQDRFALEDIEVGGEVIQADDGIIFHAPTANRDPKMFADPDVLDITRQGPRHMAFGWGAHQCVGQNLARAELQEAFTAVIAAFPGLRLAVPEAELVFNKNKMVVGATSLPITWDH